MSLRLMSGDRFDELTFPEAEPWTRAKGESPKAFAAFCGYRQLGPTRSLRSLAAQLGKPVSILAGWSTTWAWVRRAQAFDDDVDRSRVLSNRAAIAEMDERQARLAVAIQTRVAQRVIGLDGQVAPLDLNKLSAFDLARLLDVSVRVERQARGEPAATVELSAQVEHVPSLTRELLRNREAGDLMLASLAALAASKNLEVDDSDDYGRDESPA